MIKDKVNKLIATMDQKLADKDTKEKLAQENSFYIKEIRLRLEKMFPLGASVGDFQLGKDGWFVYVSTGSLGKKILNDLDVAKEIDSMESFLSAVETTIVLYK